jgi:iron complex transport system substrate-binding protein
MTGGMDALMQIPGVAQTPAAENDRFLVFDDLYLLGFGPRIGDAIYDLTLALYPQIGGTPRHPEWQGVGG